VAQVVPAELESRSWLCLRHALSRSVDLPLLVSACLHQRDQNSEAGLQAVLRGPAPPGQRGQAASAASSKHPETVPAPPEGALRQPKSLLAPSARLLLRPASLGEMEAHEQAVPAIQKTNTLGNAGHQQGASCAPCMVYGNAEGDQVGTLRGDLVCWHCQQGRCLPRAGAGTLPRLPAPTA
jgi:hypothetical protein